MNGALFTEVHVHTACVHVTVVLSLQVHSLVQGKLIG